MKELDPEIRKDVITRWKSNSVKLIAEMTASCSLNDWQALGTSAHSFKGAAAQFGACNVASKAKALEDHVTSGNPSSSVVCILIESLNDMFQKTLQHIIGTRVVV